LWDWKPKLWFSKEITWMWNFGKLENLDLKNENRIYESIFC
jgi:hypothetical protein